MTLKQMVARIMRALPHTMPGSIGELDVINILNEAQLNIASMTGKTKEESVTLDGDDDTIPMPSDSLKIVTVYWGADKTELASAIGDVPSKEVTGDPTRYYTYQGNLIVRPTPASETTYYVVYIPKPVDLADDADTAFLPGSEEYLISYVLYRIHLEANSPQFQIWDMERMRALAMFKETMDQDYDTPFRILPQW